MKKLLKILKIGVIDLLIIIFYLIVVQRLLDYANWGEVLESQLLVVGGLCLGAILIMISITIWDK